MSDARPREPGLHLLVRLVGLSQGLQPVLAFGISVLIARQLGPDGRGAYGLVVSTTAVLPILVGLGFDSAVRYWSARGEADRGSLLKSSTLLALGFGALSAGVGVAAWALGKPDWLVPPGLGSLSAAAFVAILLLAPLRGFWTNYLNGLERYGFGTMGVNAAVAAQLIALALASWLLGPSLDAVMLTLLLQYVVATALFLAVAGRDCADALRAPSLGLDHIRGMFRYGRWIYLSGLLMQTNVRVNVFIVTAFGGVYATGLYTAASGLANSISLVATPLNAVITARTVRRSDDAGFAGRVAGALRLVLVLTTLPAIAGALVAPLVLPWVFGEPFVDAVLPFQLFMPGVVAFSLSRVVLPYLAGLHKTTWTAGITAIGAAFTLLFSFALIPSYGASGAAAGWSLAMLIATGAALFGFVRVGRIGVRELVSFRTGDWIPLLRVVGLAKGRGGT